MKKEETKPFIRWCIPGAVGCGFMAAGDWLLGCKDIFKNLVGFIVQSEQDLDLMETFLAEENHP